MYKAVGQVRLGKNARAKIYREVCQHNEIVHICQYGSRLALHSLVFPNRVDMTVTHLSTNMFAKKNQ